MTYHHTRFRQPNQESPKKVERRLAVAVLLRPATEKESLQAVGAWPPTAEGGRGGEQDERQQTHALPCGQRRRRGGQSAAAVEKCPLRATTTAAVLPGLEVAAPLLVGTTEEAAAPTIKPKTLCPPATRHGDSRCPRPARPLARAAALTLSRASVKELGGE